MLVDLPKDVTAAKLTVRPDVTPRVAQRMAEKAAIMNMEQGLTPELTARLAKLINGAKRPVIYAGQGVISSGAVAQLREFAERGNIPVTTTLLGACAACGDAGGMTGCRSPLVCATVSLKRPLCQPPHCTSSQAWAPLTRRTTGRCTCWACTAACTPTTPCR